MKSKPIQPRGCSTDRPAGSSLPIRCWLPGRLRHCLPASAQRALSPEDQKLNDAVLALMALGFKQLEAHDAARKVQTALGPQATVEDLVRACLKKGA